MIFMFHIVLIFVSLFAYEGTLTENVEKRLSQCAVKFNIRNAGLDVTGTIDSVTAEIKFDPECLSQSTIVATADPATIRTGIAIRDRHLKRSDYFDIAHYPLIQLRSIKFQYVGKNKFNGQFHLTIKNITQTVTIPFMLTQNGNATVYKGRFEINRLDYYLGEMSSILGEKVSIELKAEIMN